MSKLQLRWIIAVMSLALVGLIGFQWYWISSVQQVNEVRFDQGVIESLQAVASKLERQEAMFWVNQRMTKSSLSPINNKAAQRVLQRKDTFPDDVIVDFSFSFSENGQLVFEQQMESRSIQRQYMAAEVAGQASDDSQIRDGNEKMNKKSEMVVTILEEMLYPRQLSNRFDPKHLDSLLATELFTRGITIPYDYVVLEGDRTNLVVMGHPQHRENLVRSPYRAGLFPNDMLGPRKELVVYFPDKSRFIASKNWFSLFSSVILISTISASFAFAVYTIIRQKKISEIKNDFINNMTHELKTPIATIGLAIEALQDSSVSRSKKTLDRYLGIIGDENARLTAHVEKVLQLAQLDKNELKLEMEYVDVHAIINEAIHKISLQIERDRGIIDFVAEANNSIVRTDAAHLLNIFMNLFDNSIKYSVDAPKILVRTTESAKTLVISIKDHGIGISKEAQKNIFQRFYRVPSGNLHDVKGFGLGLAYVKTITEIMGGTIEMDSEPGKGSIFYLKFPLIDE